MVFINPEILETRGTQCGEEGCLSVPGEFDKVERPNYVKVKALNEKGEEFILEGEGLLARAILHENDHLNGILNIDLSDDIREMTWEETKTYREQHPYKILSKDYKYDFESRRIRHFRTLDKEFDDER